MTRNVDVNHVMEEKMNLVTKFYFYFYLDGQC
jgi:hypothetical protein